MREIKHCNIIGPFTEPQWHYAEIDGYKIPYLKLRPLTGKDDGKIEVHIEHCVWILDADGIDVVLNMVAKAMAVAAGYTCHGEHSERSNPFKVKMMKIG